MKGETPYPKITFVMVSSGIQRWPLPRLPSGGAEGLCSAGAEGGNSLSVTTLFSHYLKVLQDLKATKPAYYYIHLFFVAGAVFVLLLVLLQSLTGGN